MNLRFRMEPQQPAAAVRCAMFCVELGRAAIGSPQPPPWRRAAPLRRKPLRPTAGLTRVEPDPAGIGGPQLRPAKARSSCMQRANLNYEFRILNSEFAPECAQQPGAERTGLRRAARGCSPPPGGGSGLPTASQSKRRSVVRTADYVTVQAAQPDNNRKKTPYTLWNIIPSRRIG